jgi:hypothetical protein
MTSSGIWERYHVLALYRHEPKFTDHFGGRKYGDFAENPLPRISMFTSIVVSSVQLMKGGGEKVEGERLKGTEE